MGLTQTELGRLAVVTPSYISKLENDPFIRVSEEMLQRLANALGVTVEEVWDSPYEELGKNPLTGPARTERAILRAYRKLGRRSQDRLLRTLIQLKEFREQNE